MANRKATLSGSEPREQPAKQPRLRSNELSLDRQRRVQLTFAARVRFFRMLRGMSSADVASAAGISRAMYSQIESGSRAPSLGVIGNLAAVLGVSIGDLFGHSASTFEPIHTRAGEGRLIQLADYPDVLFEWIGGADLGPVRVSSVIGTSFGKVQGKASFQFDGLWIDHIVAGDALVEVGGCEYRLQRGETLTYRAEVPLRLIRCSDDLRVLSTSVRMLSGWAPSESIVSQVP